MAKFVLMGWGLKRRMGLSTGIAALALAGIGGAGAEPVAIEDRSTLWLVSRACATWVAPVSEDGDLVGYDQTEVCGNIQDRDGDNAIGAGDSSYATIWQARCASPNLQQQCGDASGTQWTVGASELMIHMPHGRAALHTTSPAGCRVDLEWTGDEPTGDSSRGPDTIDSSTDPVRITYHQRYSGQSRREAAVDGTACLAPSGVTPSGVMTEDYYGDRYTGVTVDPTG